MRQEIVERTHEYYMESRLLDAKALMAANEPVIEGSRPQKGWDPFEIWRTRVREMRRALPKRGEDIQR